MRVLPDDDELEIPVDGPAIVTAPGLYMTADGHRVRVNKVRPASEDVYPAKGVLYSQGKEVHTVWRLSGRMTVSRPHPHDIVKKGW
jgi:hypothetical protein